MAVGRIDLDGGEVTILDQTVKPFYRGKVSAMTLRARGVRFPENAFDDATFTATLPGGAPLKVDAKQVKGTISVTADGKALPLPQFNPYVMQAAGYSISDGRLTVSTKVRWAPDGYDSKTNLQFDKLGVAGAEGDSLFLQKVGIPLQLALSLLRDPYGKIALGVPVKGGKGGTQVDIGSIVAQALVQAILGAVTSPLKLLGAASGILTGGSGAIAPEPIPCGPGRPTVEAAASERVQQLRRRARCRAGAAHHAPRQRRWTRRSRAARGGRARRPAGEAGRAGWHQAPREPRRAECDPRLSRRADGRWERDARAGVPARRSTSGRRRRRSPTTRSVPSRRRARRA